MKQLLLIKYASEIFLKGLNRNKFEKLLKDNIKAALKGLEYTFVTDTGRWFIGTEEVEAIVEKLKKVFGVTEICYVSQTEADLDMIKDCALKEMNEILNSKNKDYITFKVETNRANKLFRMNSLEVSGEVGAYLLKNTEGLKVNVRNPEYTLNVEIREKAYIFVKRIKGAGGLPYGVNGSTMLMLSGGIDSPVAGYLMARRGVSINCVYYHSHPYTSEKAKDKVKELAGLLKEYTRNIALYVVPFTEIQMQIIEKCPENELTIIMRRFMMRIACRLAEKLGVQSVATGESIGQVASQTMEGLIVSDDVADRPAFRPLIAMDKIDIMDISRKIGTYETSILPYEDCCTIFVPKHPKTKPKLVDIKKSESVLEFDKLTEEAIENMETFYI